MLLQNLEAAIGPAIALLLVGLESVGQEPMTVALVGVVHLPSALENGEPEVGVFADRITRPAPGGFERGAADEAHGAVHDDGV